MANTTWDESKHPRDEEGKFTFKDGLSGENSNKEEKTSEKANSKPILKGHIEKNDNLQEIKGLGEIREEPDEYTKELISEIKNKEIDIDGIGKIKVQDLIPNIEDYIEDNRTKDEKRADLLYPSMKKNNPIMYDVDLVKRIFPYYYKRLKNDLKRNNTFSDILKSSEWNMAMDYYMSFMQSLRKSFNNSLNIDKLLNSIPENELEIMIDDYINGSFITEFVAANIVKIPDAAGLLRINGKNSSLNTYYTRHAKIYNKVEELPDRYKQVIKDKLQGQHLDEKSQGIYFQSYSAFSKRIANSKELSDFIKENTNNIPLFINNGRKYPLKGSITYANDLNFRFAIHKADVINLKYDIFGNISGDIIDTTDFNDNEYTPIIHAANTLQKREKIKPKFIIVHFIKPKNKFTGFLGQIFNKDEVK